MPLWFVFFTFFAHHTSYAKEIHPNCLAPFTESIETLRRTNPSCNDLIRAIKKGVPVECQHYVFSELDPELQKIINASSNFGLHEKVSVIFGQLINSLKNTAGADGCISPPPSMRKAVFSVSLYGKIGGQPLKGDFHFTYDKPFKKMIKGHALEIIPRWIIPSSATRGHYRLDLLVTLEGESKAETFYENFGVSDSFASVSQDDSPKSFKITYTIQKKNH